MPAEHPRVDALPSAAGIYYWMPFSFTMRESGFSATGLRDEQFHSLEPLPHAAIPTIAQSSTSPGPSIFSDLSLRCGSVGGEREAVWGRVTRSHRPR